MKSEYLDFKNCIDYNQLQKVSQSLIDGNLVIFPTDTVYGIGCNPFSETAINKLFHAKNRPLTKPINVLISNIEMLECLATDITETEYKLMRAFWPGPLTIILKKNSKISDALTSGLDTIGIRIPDNKIALELIKHTGMPIATSSANISDYLPGTDIAKIAHYFKDTTSHMIDGGPSSLSMASTIVKIENDNVNILRQGNISKYDIKKVLERS